MTGQADVEASDARGGRAPDPRDDGKEGPRRQAGQHPDRGGLRQMRRAEPRPGGKGRNPRQIRLQAMRRQAGDAVGVSFRHCEERGAFFLLPLWEKVARTKSVPDEGSLSAETDPSPVSIALRAIDPPSPTRGEGTLRPIIPPSRT